MIMVCAAAVKAAAVKIVAARGLRRRGGITSLYSHRSRGAADLVGS